MRTWKNIAAGLLCCTALTIGGGQALAKSSKTTELTTTTSDGDSEDDYVGGLSGVKTEQALDVSKLQKDGTSSTPPDSYDLTKWAVAPGRQGRIKSCVGWTIGRDLAGWYANYLNKSVTEFAPMYVYSQINLGKDNGTDGGAFAVDAIKLVIDQGIDTASDYTQGYSDYKDLPTQAEKSNAAQYKSQLFSNYWVIYANSNGNGGSDLSNAIKLAIANNHPVAIALKYRAGHGGFKKLRSDSSLYDNVSGKVVEGHEVLALGYNADGLVIENHWGTRWGDKGFATLSWKVVEQDVMEAVYTY